MEVRLHRRKRRQKRDTHCVVREPRAELLLQGALEFSKLCSCLTACVFPSSVAGLRPKSGGFPKTAYPCDETEFNLE